MSAVGRISVSALLALGERIMRPRAEATASALLSRAGLLLTGCLLAVVLVVLLVSVALLLGCKVLGGIVVGCGGECARL